MGASVMSVRACVAAAGAVLAIVPACAGAAPAPSDPAWAVQPTPPLMAGLDAVSCPGRHDCVAVGSGGELDEVPLTAAWNGEAWTIQPNPSPPATQLLGVSCTSPGDCIAVGYDLGVDATQVSAQPLALHWDGLVWAIMPVRALADGGALSAVSCVAANACTAVGWSGARALVEGWNGARWTVQPAPSPAGASSAELYGVSCTSRATCVAVGDQNGGSGDPLTLAEHWDGTTWAVDTPSTALQGSLRGVSCTSASACTAVGWSGSNTSLAEGWDGAQWVVQPTPDQPGERYDSLFGVSCTSATSCVAIGDDVNPALPTPAAWHWDGTVWTIRTLPVPPDAVGAQLFGVSCTSAVLCTAVGQAYTDSSITTRSLLAERYS